MAGTRYDHRCQIPLPRGTFPDGIQKGLSNIFRCGKVPTGEWPPRSAEYSVSKMELYGEWIPTFSGMKLPHIIEPPRGTTRGSP
jgi:hypothetical protein